MSGNAIIKDNTASSGGGVSVSGSTFTMSGGTIQDNTGGVYVSSSGSIFTMSGGTIQGNTVSSSGGGVCVSDGTFTKTGGTIYGDDNTTHTAGSTENTATYDGHAVFVYASPTKRRNADAGTTLNLYAKNSGGSWTFIDVTEGGAGDTTANWD
jgi:hypothetical protein